MAEEFDGFANAVDPKGKPFDAREVPAYVDESEAGKIRDASIATPSSITQFKTQGKGTNGAPMAVVPAPAEVEDVADEDVADVTPEDEDAVADPAVDPAEGKEGDES